MVTRSCIILSLILTSLFCFGQVSPVSWTIEQAVVDDQTQLVILADIQQDWKIYSRETEEGGPIPTSIEFKHSDNITLDGEYIEQDKPVVKNSELFMMNVASFSKSATFIQPIDSFSQGEKITAIVTFMCCSGNQCLPPTDVELEITL